ncbi:MAG: DUF2927 domain-containing protein [Rhodobacteraceae bacterium]|nr:DUF2927 domain-containing protein [Paracoccaceae bacterium]
MRFTWTLQSGLMLIGALVLIGCEMTSSDRAPSAVSAPTAPVPRSPQSQDLEHYYRVVQNNLLTHGLLRTDGGGPDTPFTPDTLATNFEQIAFFSEYTRGTLTPGSGGSERLSRWGGPVRIGTEFGASVPADQRARDAASVKNYTNRLARVTGHSISNTTRNANFHVFVAGEDDRDFIQTRLKQLVPNISQTELDLFRDLPRSIYCLVVAVSGSNSPNNYTRAVALIRAEHPDLVRLSCIHEEIAQGLGLPNDSAAARPSIFNDDDEFALLTSHDELLLKMLYDPRLKQGMTADQARPVVRIIARDLMGQNL